MGAMTQERELDELNFRVKVPRHLPAGVPESLEEGVARAVQILVQGSELVRLYESADEIAKLVVSQVHPSTTLVQDRMARMGTIRKMLEEGDWLSAEDINRLQASPPKIKSLPASDWKRRGRIFSVTYDGKDYYARFQFDALYQPLPLIKDILDAYGEYADAWTLAAWFHFPNGWLVTQGPDGAAPVAPKDVLDRGAEVIDAARRRRGTYVA